jgi:hypothetical protein
MAVGFSTDLLDHQGWCQQLVVIVFLEELECEEVGVRVQGLHRVRVDVVLHLSENVVQTTLGVNQVAAKVKARQLGLADATRTPLIP